MVPGVRLLNCFEVVSAPTESQEANPGASWLKYLCKSVGEGATPPRPSAAWITPCSANVNLYFAGFLSPAPSGSVPVQRRSTLVGVEAVIKRLGVGKSSRAVGASV